jgi:predicted ArsR family transcriptional regulator
MGRPPSVPTEEVLQAVVLHPDPVVTTSDLADQLDLSHDGIRERLKSLSQEGLLKEKKVGGSAVVFYITEKGRNRLAEAEGYR